MQHRHFGEVQPCPFAKSHTRRIVRSSSRLVLDSAQKRVDLYWDRGSEYLRREGRGCRLGSARAAANRRISGPETVPRPRLLAAKPQRRITVCLFVTDHGLFVCDGSQFSGAAAALLSCCWVQRQQRRLEQQRRCVVQQQKR
eukprot:3036181-Rhodomonas_salina.1